MIWGIDLSLTLWSIKGFSKISFPNMFDNDLCILLGYIWIRFAIGMLLISILRRFCIFLVLEVLKDKQQFKHGEFDNFLMHTSFWGYFATFLRELCALSHNLYSYSRFMLGCGCLMCFARF